MGGDNEQNTLHPCMKLSKSKEIKKNHHTHKNGLKAFANTDVSYRHTAAAVGRENYPLQHCLLGGTCVSISQQGTD